MRRVALALFATTLAALAAIIGLLSMQHSDLGAQPTQTRQATESLNATGTVIQDTAVPASSAVVSVLPTPVPTPSLPPPPTATPAVSLAPDFTLHSAQGTTITLSTYRGKSNVVLVFYRGQT